MVQTYGIVPESSADSEPSLDTDEARTLLASPGTPSKRNKHEDGPAGLLSCISNLSNTIIGSGT